MPVNQALIDDVMTLCRSLLGGVADARHELKAQVKEHAENVAKKLDLVGREEFDAAMAMLSKARAAEEDMRDRLNAVEAKLKMSSASATPKSMKANLPSVKKGNRRARRK